MVLRIYKFASSVRLAVWLLILLAVFAAIGTAGVIPQGFSPEEYTSRLGAGGKVILALGLDNYFTSIPYRALFFLLTINLLLCSYGRTLAGFSKMRGEGTANLEIKDVDLKGTKVALIDAGFKVSENDGGLIAFRRRFAFLGFPLVHLAPFAIILGSFIGTEMGQIVTSNVYVGEKIDTFYDWKTKENVKVGFTIDVKDRTMTYHPGELRIKVLFGEGKEGRGLINTRPGEIFDIVESTYQGEVREYFPETGNMRYYIMGQGETFGPFERGKEEGAPIRLRPFATRNFELKQTVAVLDVYEGPGQEPRTVEVSVNAPLTVGGYWVYLTSWGEDDTGKPFIGLQVVKDPGQPLVWIGSVFLILGIFLLLYGEAGWARVEGGNLMVSAPRNVREAIEKGMKEGNKGG